MEARGYGSRRPRTSMYKLNFKRVELAVTLLTLTLLTLTVLLRLYLPTSVFKPF